MHGDEEKREGGPRRSSRHILAASPMLLGDLPPLTGLFLARTCIAATMRWQGVWVLLLDHTTGRESATSPSTAPEAPNLPAPLQVLHDAIPPEKGKPRHALPPPPPPAEPQACCGRSSAPACGKTALLAPKSSQVLPSPPGPPPKPQKLWSGRPPAPGENEPSRAELRLPRPPRSQPRPQPRPQPRKRQPRMSQVQAASERAPGKVALSSPPFSSRRRTPHTSAASGVTGVLVMRQQSHAKPSPTNALLALPGVAGART